MDYRQTLAFALCILLSAGGFVACGDPADNPEQNDEQNSEQNDGANDDNGDNGDNDNNGENDEEFPLDGLYEVTSHTENEQGCEGDGDELDEYDYFKLSGSEVNFQFITYSMEWCESASLDDCDESAGSLANIEDISGHTDGDLQPGTTYSSRGISMATSAGGQCTLEGSGSEFEITEEGLIIENLTLELEFDTNEESYDCESDWDEPSQETYDALECVEIERIEGSFVE